MEEIKFRRKFHSATNYKVRMGEVTAKKIIDHGYAHKILEAFQNNSTEEAVEKIRRYEEVKDVSIRKKSFGDYLQIKFWE